MDNNVELLKQAFTAIQKKNDKEKTDNSINMKPAKVIGTDDSTHKVFAYFLDDAEQQQYTFYNKSGENISEGDTVKIFYTTNPAKGWVGARAGEPDITAIKPYVPYVSQIIKNTNETEISDIISAVIDVDFTVDGSDSAVVVNANQIVSASQAGTINFAYVIDGTELEFKPKKIVSVGDNLITHIIPLDLLMGEHNIVINQFSPDAIATTENNNFQGVISGIISNVNTSSPPNYNCIFKLNIPADNTLITFPSITSQSLAGNIYWGDGSYESYNNTTITHTYEKAGIYKVVITNQYSSIDSGITTLRDYLIEVQLSDNIIELGRETFRDCSNLRSIAFGSKLQTIGQTAFVNTGLSGTLTMPKTLTTLGNGAFFGSTITNLIFDCPNLVNYPQDHYNASAFDTSNQLTTIYYNAPKVQEYTFWSCTALKKVTIGSSTKEIGKDAFALCTYLEELIISSSVKFIGHYAFSACSYLNTVTLASDCTYYSDSFNANTTITGGTLIS